MMPDPVLASTGSMLFQRPGGRPERQAVVAVRDSDLIKLVHGAIRQEQPDSLITILKLASQYHNGHSDGIVDRLSVVHRGLKLATFNRKFKAPIQGNYLEQLRSASTATPPAATSPLTSRDRCAMLARMKPTSGEKKVGNAERRAVERETQRQINPMAQQQTWWERYKTPLEIVAALVGFAGVIWAAGSWVDSRAKDAVLNEKFLGELAAKVRPTCIFNSKGVVEADLGASDYLEEIKVHHAAALYGYEIEVKLKQHLPYAPLISCIDANLFAAKVERVAPHGWYYQMTPNSTVGNLIVNDHFPTNSIFRFKLEILH